MVKLAKSYQQLVAGEITESVHFYAENIGGGQWRSVWLSKSLLESPGPWDHIPLETCRSVWALVNVRI